MPVARWLRGPVAVLLFLALVGAGCGGSTASYTRARRAADEGRMIAASEVRAADFIAYHAAEDAPRPAPSAELRLPVLLDARLGSSVVATTGGRALVQVSLRGGTSAMRTPSRMVVVLDVSGSMQEGDKIGAVRHALARFVEVLDPADELAIVTFSDEAHVALAPTTVGAARETILSAVGSLSAYGGTNLHAGLGTGLALAAQMRDPGSVTRVVFLSDGMASVGVTDSTALARHGDAARDLGVALTTLGVGGAIDFALLEALATRSGGAFHYVDQPSEVERLFADEIRALVSLAARDVHVRVRLPAGVTLAQSYDERTHLRGDVLDTPVGDLGSDEAVVVLFELSVSPGALALALPVEVTLAGPDGGATLVASTSLAAARVEGMATDVVSDLSVLRNATLGRLATALRDAAAASERGAGTDAWTTLTAALDLAGSARARLSAAGDEPRARSLDEPMEVIARARDLCPRPAPAAPPASGWSVTTAPGSADFSGWR